MVSRETYSRKGLMIKNQIIENYSCHMNNKGNII
uniref:Uncharacterized protein n=1 Tax=Arundo donax TaxID=35708 RepID=A0A0A9AZ84_ARUDO